MGSASVYWHATSAEKPKQELRPAIMLDIKRSAPEVNLRNSMQA